MNNTSIFNFRFWRSRRCNSFFSSRFVITELLISCSLVTFSSSLILLNILSSLRFIVLFSSSINLRAMSLISRSSSNSSSLAVLSALGSGFNFTGGSHSSLRFAIPSRYRIAVTMAMLQTEKSENAISITPLFTKYDT